MTGQIILVSILLAIVGIVQTRQIDVTSNRQVAASVAAAALADPGKFADAAKTTAEAGSLMIENTAQVIDVLEKARNFIVSATSYNDVTIVNLSNKGVTWYVYNQWTKRWKKWYPSTYQSYMGAYTTITAGINGWEDMVLYKDDKDTPFTVRRGAVYLFDGDNLTLFVEDVEKAQQLIKKENFDIENEWMDCWDACGEQQGSCTWCGTKGMCCTQKSGWTDTSNGCDGTFGGWERHECTLKE